MSRTLFVPVLAFVAIGVPIALTQFLATEPSAGRNVESETARRDDVDFNRDIRPILSQHCLICHGPDEETREADLRLDIRDEALAELDSGERAIVPHDTDASELIYRVTSDDESLRMPPFESGKRLTEAEIELLQRWIEQGASYAEHWSFVAPDRPALPEVNAEDWPTHPIDHFVLHRLEQAGLAPELPASPYTLIRRVALDLTGLPPTPAEVRQFVEDTRPGAYERMVDRYLASPAFGERWGAVWLDLARYADSQGYAQDPPRTIWRYRDWVIEAINDDLSFDQFTVEQLAGDLLEDPTEAQRIATAFHRNTMTNSEGGTDNEEFRVAAVVDRVNTTMAVWMGLTFGCAQCHTHKYDPISQKEYFEVFAVLNQTEDADLPSDAPLLETYSRDQQKRMARLRAQITAQEQWVAEQSAASNRESPAAEESLPNEGPIVGRIVRVQSLGSGKFLHLAEVEVFVGETNVAVSGEASQISTDFGGPAGRANDGNTDGHYNEAKSTSHTAQEDNPWWEVRLADDQPIDRIVVWNRTDSEAVKNRLDRFRVIVMDKERRPVWVEEVNAVPNPNFVSQVPGSFDQLDQPARNRIIALARETGAGTTAAEQKLNELKKQLADIKPAIKTPVMRELGKNRQRESFVHVRGNFRSRGESVSPGVPAIFPPLPESTEAKRLAMARWLTADDNPLTARVTVNRFWEHLFGQGIVSTSEDFGTQGSLPTHPQLLDWLAVEYRESGWNTKRLLRMIVCSQTYRQSSRVSPEKLAVDPYNELISRGPRFRLSAEMIRDQALAVSGLLSRRMKGPSVQPPRPNLGLRAAFGGSTDWTTSPGEDKFRRGLYTSWRRTTPYPSMTTFDATSREVCTIRRIRTNTPLQALVTLNDPVYVEAAQSLAREVLQMDAKDDTQRIINAVERVLIRPAMKYEVDVLEDMLMLARDRYANQPDQAMLMATDPIGALPEGMDPVEAAAWTVLANGLLNLDETLARP